MAHSVGRYCKIGLAGNAAAGDNVDHGVGDGVAIDNSDVGVVASVVVGGYIDIRYSDDQFFDVFDLQRKVQSHHGPFSFSIGIHGMVRNISAILEDCRGKRKK